METEELDILVIGGGVTGTGAALDAVTRGLNTGLVEMRDWASGTSSRSTKLLHGGLRYLEMLDFGLVREALRERGLVMQKLAPYLTRPIPFIYPLTHKGWERLYVGSGILLYDVMAREKGASKGVPNHKHLSKSTIMKLFPGLDPDVCVGAIRYYDGQVDDARHTMLLARTAASHGAHVASRAQVTELLRDAGRVVGAVVRDLETGKDHTVRARAVINATGVWTDEMQELLGEEGEFTVKASKGIHILVPRDRIKAKVGMILRTPTSVLFTIPWHNHWIIGTTDTEYDLDKADPTASAEDIEYVLGQANRVLKQKLTKDDIVGTYAGLRPLVAGQADTTAKLSREHLVIETTPGMIVVAGGKYTTYRVMAYDTVDAALESMGKQAGPCITKDVPIVGVDGYHAAWNRRELMAEKTGLHVGRIEHLLKRYGSLSEDVLALSEEDASLLEPLPVADSYLKAEVVYATREEGALHLEDVLVRRSHINIEVQDRGRAAAPVVADLMAKELGWSDEQRDAELEAYLTRIDAELKANAAPTDEEAQEARREAPDVVALA
ncbi:MAG: glycerol-3-phosphate dehydrogenase/oxidase [Nitriliruptor sp.]|nr:MAG: glycerol-3-phosphate dehydrogenase/oxidase [Nitriliruptor sp.]